MSGTDGITLQLIRSATLKLVYAGKTILVDPMLSPEGTLDPFAGKERNPTVGLPAPAASVVQGVDAVLVTHTHPDHFDRAAVDILPKDIPLFAQPTDTKSMTRAGFADVRPVGESLLWEGILIRRTGGRHGRGLVVQFMGRVSGFVLSAAGCPTIYLVGDSVLESEVKKAIETFRPDIVVANSGGAMVGGSHRILMDAEETIELARLAPWATIVAVHMEALDHCTVTRAALRAAASDAGIGERLLIPSDGETVLLSVGK